MPGIATSGKTKRRTGRWSQRDVSTLIPHIRELAAFLQECSEPELAAEAQSLRQELIRGTEIASPELLVAGTALATEALRRAYQVVLYDVQLLAVLNLATGRIVQMATGEGKTFVAITTAVHLALAGKGVHVMTPNSYLAERDCEQARSVFAQLGMTAGLTAEQAEPDDKRQAYDCDVTYGTGHEFGFDYLRDQLTLRSQARSKLGSRLLEELRTKGPGQRDTMQRGLAYAVVDEADSVLVDDAGSPLVLSMSAAGEASDRDAHLVARDVADILQEDTHFRWDRSTSQITLTSEGQNRCYKDDIAIPVEKLQRPWTAYVEQALRAAHIFTLNVHYVITDGEVKIVDETTGRIFDDRSWQDGLHQAIEAREGLPITPEKESLARITRQRFFRLYKNLCGMTGTAVGCEKEFLHVYRCRTAEIPLHRPSARQMLPTRCFATRDAKHVAIVQEIQAIHETGRPVLVGTQSITDSEAIAARLDQANLSYQLLNGLQTAEEAEIIAQAGQQAVITISTNLAGRGTDITVPPDVLELGGLHVIVAECQTSGRMDRQLIGRCARQGNPGSARTYVSAEDTLLARFGNWLAQAIIRESDESLEADADFTTAIRRVQEKAEKHHYLGRAELLRQDIATDSLFGNG